MAFVGGGYIAFEFAHVAARADAAVSILHRGQRTLAGFDGDLVAQLIRSGEALRIEVHVGTSVTAVVKHGEELIVHALQDSHEVEVAADVVVHAAGRVPEVDDLDLETAGVARGENGGVAVNQYLQSVSNPAVYAAGDAVASGGLPPFPGGMHATGAANLRNGNTRTPNYLGIPTVVFTTPPLARVGLDEDGAPSPRTAIHDQPRRHLHLVFVAARRARTKHVQFALDTPVDH